MMHNRTDILNTALVQTASLMHEHKGAHSQQCDAYSKVGPL